MFSLSSPGSSVQSLSGDFIDLDEAVRQRRQEMEESSSSDSQTPDYENIAGNVKAPTGDTNTEPASCSRAHQQDEKLLFPVYKSSPRLFTAAEFPVPPFLDVLKHTDRAAAPEHQNQPHTVKNQHQNQHQNQQNSDNKRNGIRLNVVR